MELRPARVDDAAALAEVHVRAWQAAYAHIFGTAALAEIDVEARAVIWRRWLGDRRPREAVFVAEEAAGPVAFSWVGENRETSEQGELYAIYALPEAWGGGAGPALMAAALGALRSLAFRSAALWVLDDNPRARRFYEREGWSVDGGRRTSEHLGVETAEVRYRIEL